MAKSKRWSLKDIETIKNYVKQALTEGKTEREGLQEAAKHFGLTSNAVFIRWLRLKKGEHVKRLKKNTTKVPLKRRKTRSDKGKRRGPRKAIKAKVDNSRIAKAFAKRVVAEANRVVLPIDMLSVVVPKVANVVVDFDAKSITYNY